MSMLAPLYLLGLAAIALPLVFHFIRRSPRGEMNFSSHMFLRASPPRLTRRSRLDNILLLFLRAAIIALLAAAFARPFLRQAVAMLTRLEGAQRVVMLVDTSASMRRGDLRQQAITAAKEVVSRLRTQDVYALYTFDETSRPLFSFEDFTGMNPAARRAALVSQLDGIQLSWSGTRLGPALIDALATLSRRSGEGTHQDATTDRIVVISDMQQGASLEGLAEQNWPTNVTLDLLPLGLANTNNAGIHRLDRAASIQTEDRVAQRRTRVRVMNTGDSKTDFFQLTWAATNDNQPRESEGVHVPPGESRVVKLPLPPDNLDGVRLELRGDAHDFDNTVFFAPVEERKIHVVFLEDDAIADQQGMRFYFEQAVQSDERGQVTVDAQRPDSEMVLFDQLPPDLIVAGSPPGPQQQTALREYVERGGTLLYVITSTEDSLPLSIILQSDPLEIRNGKVSQDVMMTDIAFDHPLFSAMAGPQFNDFTQIRFWKYRSLNLGPVPRSNTIARFENSEPAIVDCPVGDGNVIVFTSGWHPDDSQLARSWKFVLMLAALTHENDTLNPFALDYHVNARVPFNESVKLAAGASVTKPDGTRILLGEQETGFSDTDIPGVYTLATADGPQHFIVQLDPAESNTAAHPSEVFEQLGCRLTGSTVEAQDTDTTQYLQDVELEGRQRAWKWLIVAAMALLLVESWLAGSTAISVSTELQGTQA